MSETASKHDGEKPRVHLVPNELVFGAARAFGFGAKKYARYNWMKGMEWTRLRDAVERHLRAWTDGEELDPESGLSHLDHAAASLAMLMGHVGRGLGKDDRSCTDKDPDGEKPVCQHVDIHACHGVTGDCLAYANSEYHGARRNFCESCKPLYGVA